MVLRSVPLLLLGMLLAGCGVSASPTSTPAATDLPTPSATSTPAPTLTTTPAPTPAPTAPATPTTAGVQAPAGLDVSYDSQDYSDGSFTLTTTVSWAGPSTPGTTVTIYGVNACLTTTESAPCATDGMSIPDANLLELATAPASDGKASWSYWAPEGASYYCGAVGVVANKGQTAMPDHWYWAIVLRSADASGTSPFVVAQTSTNDAKTC